MIALVTPEGLSKQEQTILAQLRSWIVAADNLGLVVTVEQMARTPLAMGNADTRISVRRKVDHRAEAAKRGGYEL